MHDRRHVVNDGEAQELKGLEKVSLFSIPHDLFIIGEAPEEFELQ